MDTFDAMMERGGEAAIRNAGKFFMKDDPVHHTLRAIVERLKELQIPYCIAVGLLSLLELKLASGMSAPHRLKDLADAQELIRILKLPREFIDLLNPYVREKFDELRTALQQSPPEE